MAPVQVEHNMASESSSPCHQGLTPPDSPKKGSATPQTTVKDLKYLFDVLERVLPDLTNREPPNSPVFHGNFQADPDMAQLKLLMGKLTYGGCASAELSMAAKSSQSCPASNEQEDGTPVADESDLKHPISTTPDDFKLFEKWAATPSFKTVVETYELLVKPSSTIISPKNHSLLSPFLQKTADADIAGTQKLVNTRSVSRWRLAVVWTTMLNTHSLSANESVRNILPGK